MDIRIEKTLTGKYVGYVDGVPVCRSSTEAGVSASLGYLAGLPYHIFASVIKDN